MLTLTNKADSADVYTQLLKYTQSEIIDKIATQKNLQLQPELP